MITKELIDFVKKMRSERHTDTEITSILIGNGWLAMDVTEAFQSIELLSKNIQTPFIPLVPPIPSITPTATATPIIQTSFQIPPNILSQINNLQPINVGIPKDISMMPKEKEKSKSHKWLIIFFVILFFVLAFGLYGYFYRDSLKNLPLIKNFFGVVEVPQTVADIPAPVVPATPEVNNVADTSVASTPVVPVITNCDNNMDCLISAVSNCQPMIANISYNNMSTILLSGIDASGQTKYEIKSASNSDQCVLLVSPISASYSISDVNRQKIIKEEKVTSTQIDTQLKQMNDLFLPPNFIPTTMTCLGDKTTIVSYLTDIKNGSPGQSSGIQFTTTKSSTSTYITSTGLKLICTQ